MICNFSADHPILYSTGRTLVTNLGNSQSENLRKNDRFLNIVIRRSWNQSCLTPSDAVLSPVDQKALRRRAGKYLLRFGRLQTTTAATKQHEPQPARSSLCQVSAPGGPGTNQARTKQSPESFLCPPHFLGLPLPGAASQLHLPESPAPHPGDPGFPGARAQLAPTQVVTAKPGGVCRLIYSNGCVTAWPHTPSVSCPRPKDSGLVFVHWSSTAQPSPCPDQLVANLLCVIATDLVPARPARREPRALKRRLKNYPHLNKPRHQYKEIPHRNKHSSTKPLNPLELI